MMPDNIREAVEGIVGDSILAAAQFALAADDTVAERVSAGLQAARLRDPAVDAILRLVSPGEPVAWRTRLIDRSDGFMTSWNIVTEEPPKETGSGVVYRESQPLYATPPSNQEDET